MAPKPTLMPPKHVKPSQQKRSAPVKAKPTSARPASKRATKDNLEAKTPELPRQSGGRFAKGYCPHAYGISNKKSPDKIGGRKRILSLFDRIIGENGHMEALEVEIRKCIDQKGMLYFYQTYILPLIPKELAIKAFQHIQASEGSALDPSTPEGKAQRDRTLRELFGLAQLGGCAEPVTAAALEGENDAEQSNTLED